MLALILLGGYDSGRDVARGGRRLPLPKEGTGLSGATNTVYTGPEHLSYVQLPLLPHDESDAAGAGRAGE